jgi:translation initiation factor IF-3
LNQEPKTGGGFIFQREKELRINGRIRINQVRLIDQDGKQLGVLPTIEAMRLAREAGLDLVEISPSAAPPVCKILDYGKYKYELKKKAQEAKKKQIVVKLKEVKMRPNTDEHDFQFKLRHIKRFLEEGDKAKVTVVFKGREMAYQDLGRQVMARILEEVKNEAKVEQPPSMEGKALIMVLAPQ